MEKRYQNIFDQALGQVEPSEGEVAQMRQTLAAKWEAQQGKKSDPRRNHKLARVALIAAAVMLVSATMAAAAVLINANRRNVIVHMRPAEFNMYYLRDEELTVFEEDGHYYLQTNTADALIDFTGQFSDTSPYVYSYYFPKSEDNSYVPYRIDYVIGRTGDHVQCVVIPLEKGGDYTFMNGTVTPDGPGLPAVTDSPVWWRTYAYEHQGHYAYLDGWDVNTANFADSVWMQPFFLVTGGLTVDEESGAVELHLVKGETLDITDALKDGVYRLSVKGGENVILSYDESLWLGSGWEFSTEDYADTFVYGPYDHTVLAYRDGDEVRWAEFIYRPDGSLRYWMPWNCPTADDLNWLKDYAAEQGLEMNWLLTHVSEKRSTP